MPATGGAIAGSGAGITTTVGYTTATVPVPELKKVADVSGEQMFQIASSRVGSGIVARHGKANDDEFDFVASDALNPQKAPILLMLALTRLAIHARSSASSGPIEQNMEGAEPLACASHR